MYPLTLQAQIMRHMLNLAKDMASGDFVGVPQESRSTHCAGTRVYSTKSCALEPFRTGCGAAR